MTTGRMIIVGGGAVGLSLACAARGFDVQVLEAAASAPAATEAFDVRVFALSPGTRAFLRDLGAWDLLDAHRLGAVRRMEVFGDAGGRLAFSARAGAALAWIVEASRLLASLQADAASLPNIRVARGVRVASCRADARGASVETESGERFEGDLLVGADGADSHVRRLLGLEAEERPYGEEALVANFDTEREHGEIARQWFRPDGVLAWLPLPGKRISIVWSAPLEHAASLASLEARAFERRVREAGGAVLGDLALASPVARFPLRRIDVARVVVAGAALVGDAAHAVHPLAGQGVNLGFQDARVLAEELAGRTALERPGDLRVLRRYARARREDVTAMQFVTEGLDRLFASELPGAAAVRNAGMGLVQSQSWIRALLAGRAMR